MDPRDVILLAAYGSLVIELTVFPIPSEASTLSLLTQSQQQEGDNVLVDARARSLVNRLVRYFLPTATGVVLFAMPLLAVLWPPLRSAFFPLTLPAFAAVGMALVIGGRLLTFWSVLQLRRAKRRASIPKGFFAYSRNPGLVGMYLFYFGLCLMCGGPWLWLGIPLYLANMHHRVRLEESQLETAHGQVWLDYRQRVPRYLPLRGFR